MNPLHYDESRRASPSGLEHDPSLEWPEDNEPRARTLDSESCDQWSAFIPLSAEDGQEKCGGQASVASSLAVSTLRLIRLPEHGAKPILPRAQRLAILDGYLEIELGRDMPPPGSDKPRLRLKDMEVSKLHATVFWDVSRHEWAIVDMGSKHGTFVLAHVAPNSPGTSVIAEDTRGQRLSSPRASSIPRRLRHLDRVSVGSTTFLVHIHEDRLPCNDCTPAGSDEIPLSNAVVNNEISKKRKRDHLPEPPALSTGDPRKALSTLKHTLLLRHSGHRSFADKASYVDRSARRRALHPEAPGASVEAIVRKAGSNTTLSHTRASSPSPPPPNPPAPLPSSNIGHRLLMKQGWAPGTALRSTESPSDDATPSIDLVSPLEPKRRAPRAGLGSLDPSPSSMTHNVAWRDEGKHRRWSNTISR